MVDDLELLLSQVCVGRESAANRFDIVPNAVLTYALRRLVKSVAIPFRQRIPKDR